MGFQCSTSVLLPLLFSSFLSLSSASTSPEDFNQCLSDGTKTSTIEILYSPDNNSYTSIFDYSTQNLRFTTPTTLKPEFIITPLQPSHIQAAVICSKKHGFQLRVRSGGHDYNGLSYTSTQPFVLIDLINFRDINVDIQDNTAWVQAGATTGELHYRIAQKSNTHGFPTSICTTVGVGGLIGGGGIGFLWRKYGLSADNILDAFIVDVNGNLLDRKSMGEDLFWAIRGGGGASFGVIVSWKIQLVRVPPIVTVFRVPKTIEQGSISLLHKWQNVAHNFPKDIHFLTISRAVQGEKGRTIQTDFEAVFQGRREDLLTLMENKFPELGLKTEDCTEMSWVNSTMYVNYLNGPAEALLNRVPSRSYWKGGSDFVKQAISKNDLEQVFEVMLELGEEYTSGMIVTEPMGGRNEEISESFTPFPHRKGYMFMIQYNLNWQNVDDSSRYLAAARRLYDFMTPLVSKSPRSSYFNYRDLNVGANRDVNTSYEEARGWGNAYFKGNFERLALVKALVDPENYFWSEQSIPPKLRMEY
ncbi:cinnamyl-alcohol dehydrogenase [Ranunculus cassubicifolius]